MDNTWKQVISDNNASKAKVNTKVNNQSDTTTKQTTPDPADKNNKVDYSKWGDGKPSKKLLDEKEKELNDKTTGNTNKNVDRSKYITEPKTETKTKTTLRQKIANLLRLNK